MNKNSYRNELIMIVSISISTNSKYKYKPIVPIAVIKMDNMYSRTVMGSYTRYKNCNETSKEFSRICNNCIRWSGRLFASKYIDAKFALVDSKIFISSVFIFLVFMVFRLLIEKKANFIFTLRNNGTKF